MSEGCISGNVVNLTSFSTVSQFLEQVKAIKGSSQTLFIAPNEIETREHLIVDMVSD